jgi:hypothetical protein
MDELPNSLKPLAKLLEKEEPKVLVLVGTGVSIGATSLRQASWLGLLKHGVDHLVETEKFTVQWGNELKVNLDSAFSPFDLDKALKFAELVEQNLSTPAQPDAFAKWLKTSFSDFKVQTGRTDTLNAIRDLQQAGALILTTNYDSLLSDATGLLPVTWDEQNEFLKASHEKNKILHIHGHWQYPNSIILGKNSYERIVKNEKIQSLLKTLWLDWVWVYVGCGGGIFDPNLGMLLRWGKEWGDSTFDHYILAKDNDIIALESNPDKPVKLISVPYKDHSELPNILRSITPIARCFPFSLIDGKFWLFRDPNSSPLDPFPSRQEYLDGEVPALGIDDEVSYRLKKYDWAFVLDVASVGKTTLALRIATSVEQRDYPVFYLDFANIDIESASGDVSAALKRLSKQNVLFIFDNAHYQSELVQQLWNQWEEINRRGSKSKLLIVATRAQRHVKMSPAENLIFFEKHKINPTVELRPTEYDLKNILNHIYLRVTKSKHSTPAKLEPSYATLKSWHKDYGNALGAFCLAVLSRLSDLEHGNWELQLTAAADWVKEKWLKKLDAEYIDNLVCLSVFGSQELELNVNEEALPYPQKTQVLMNRGLVAKIDFGKFEKYHTYALREAGWGGLILATQTPSVNEDNILFTCASYDARMVSKLRIEK